MILALIVIVWVLGVFGMIVASQCYQRSLVHNEFFSNMDDGLIRAFWPLYLLISAFVFGYYVLESLATLVSNSICPNKKD